MKKCQLLRLTYISEEMEDFGGKKSSFFSENVLTYWISWVYVSSDSHKLACGFIFVRFSFYGMRDAEATCLLARSNSGERETILLQFFNAQRPNLYILD